MAKFRKRPTFTVTMDPDIEQRVRALVEKLPGATLSQVVDELLGASLPIYEDMAESIVLSRRPDGSVDDERAEQLIGAAIGARIVKATGMRVTERDLEAEREARLDAAHRGERPYRKAPVQDTPKGGGKTT